jgi:hypothetical protein
MSETNRIHLVLIGIQNRTLGSYLAANNRNPISEMVWQGRVEKPDRPPGTPSGATAYGSRLLFLIRGHIFNILLIFSCGEDGGAAQGGQGCLFYIYDNF